ncbi:MAG TPA: cell division protein ZapD [Burkholderiales bacterium]|nr:cell division protein ZapD [Burkholderiales bacterium]
MISYDFPLNERIRTLLRMEALYERVHFFSSKEHPLEHHAALLSLFEILDVAGRADLKSEMMQELERQKQTLSALRSNPAISEEALSGVLTDIDRAVSDLFQSSGKTGQELRENEWLMGIKQRSAIPGGVCEFDLPSYHFWLHQDAATRRRDLESWLAPFLPMQDGISIILRILRESGRTSQQMATQGLYQQMMGGRVAQLVRLRLQDSFDCVPEVSANKYALNIRFTVTGDTQRRVAHVDIPFELTFCNL